MLIGFRGNSDKTTEDANETQPLMATFDATPEIFATDNHGSFRYPLLHGGKAYLDTEPYDEIRVLVSVWHPSEDIDLDQAYLELRASFDEANEHWMRISEIEPVVPPQQAGQSFDGWVILPILGPRTAYCLLGSGFSKRTRLQIRASAYLVA